MSAAIVIRTYDRDFPFLAYCLRSIAKFARGFSEVIVLVPEGQERGLAHLTAETVIPVADGQPGYLAQQVSKLYADKHTEADYILHLDSDTILTRPTTPDSFMANGRPRWLLTPMVECPDAAKAWLHVMVKCCRAMPTHDFMRRNAIFIPRWAYAAFREFVETTHGMPLDAYIMAQPGREFSEYNTLGFYLWLHHRERIHWHDTARMGVPESRERQFWSWGGLTAAVKAEIEEALR